MKNCFSSFENQTHFPLTQLPSNENLITALFSSRDSNLKVWSWGGVKVYSAVLLMQHNPADSFHCISHIRPQYYFYSSSRVFHQGQMTGSAHHDGRRGNSSIKGYSRKILWKKQAPNRWQGSRKYRPPISSSPFVDDEIIPFRVGIFTGEGPRLIYWLVMGG